MLKLLKLAAIGGLALTFAGPVLAQGAMKDMMTHDQSMRTSKMVGMTVFNEAGDNIGKVLDVLIRAGAEPQLVVNVGEYVGATGPRIVAIPLSKLSLSGAKPMMMGATKGALMSMPIYAGDFGSG